MNRRLRSLAILAGATALAFDTACYAYHPAAGPLTPERQRVRLQLTPDGTTELARYLGPRISTVEGVLVARQPDGALEVGVESVQTGDGIRQSWSGEGTVSFPAAFVAGVEVNTLDRQKSVLGGLVLTAGIIAISIAALKVSGSQGDPGAGGTTPP